MLKPIKYRCYMPPWWKIDRYIRFYPQCKGVKEYMLIDMLRSLFACGFTIQEWIDYKEAHKLPPLLEYK